MATEADTRRRFVVPLLQAALDALKRLQAETAAELDGLLPAILQSSPGFDAAVDRAFKRES